MSWARESGTGEGKRDGSDIARESGTGPILQSQATFLLAHIANSGPVPLRPWSPKVVPSQAVNDTDEVALNQRRI